MTKFRWTVLMLIIGLSNSSGNLKSQVKIIWYEDLPDCPCKNPDFYEVKLNDGWAKDKGDIKKYHKGATECFRSYPFTKTSIGNSGQQCCFDIQGNLIKSGAGAGTPDKVSTCNGEDKNGQMKLRLLGIYGHYFKDVTPWNKAGNAEDAWKSYNTQWVPNQGLNCN
ncbi:hypothetical protein [Runella sp.]|uniref:hypothetical protein n=1 Tax=Runella sp. TaxID=1960881 RepID=UPI003D0A35D2